MIEQLLLQIDGIPLHPLLVHFAVVLFPIAQVAFIVATIFPKLRQRFLDLTVIGSVLTLPFLLLAQLSGGALASEYYLPSPHSALGSYMTQVGAFSVAIGLLFRFSVSRKWNLNLSRVLGFVSVSAAVGAIAMVIAVGHSGSSATWTGVL